MKHRSAELIGFILGLQMLAVLASPAIAAPASHPAPHSQPATRPAGTQNLLAHGTEQYFWVARVSAAPEGGELTRISFRTAGTEGWQNLADLPARVTGLANYGAQLAVLREGGEWSLLSENGSGSSGLRLPDGALMLALANDASTLWAVASVTSRPATSTRPATSRPVIDAAAPPIPHLAFFTLDAGDWKPAAVAPLPANLPVDAAISFAIIDRIPHLAIQRNSASVEVFRAEKLQWVSIAKLPNPAGFAFKLIPGMSPPTLWLAGPTGDQVALIRASGPLQTIKLKDMGGTPNDRSAVYAINTFREIALVGGKISEQDYDSALKPSESSGTVSMPAAPTPSVLTGLFRLGLTLALIFAIFASSRRRREMTEQNGVSEDLVLAELSRRFIAGLIDGIPFIAPIAVLYQMHRDTAANPQGDPAHAQLLWVVSLAAVVVYLVHTAATEALAGRSIGKMLLGLRVVRLDGGTPDPSALLVRNFLRVLDVGLAGVPLVFIAFSPLRQRIGDVAAGTVVIRDRVRPEGNLVEPRKEENATQTQQVKPPEAAGD